jgi:hypothetical protein
MVVRFTLTARHFLRLRGVNAVSICVVRQVIVMEELCILVGLTELHLKKFVDLVVHLSQVFLFSMKHWFKEVRCGFTFLMRVFGIAAMNGVTVDRVELYTRVTVCVRRRTLISRGAEFGVNVFVFI